MDHFYKDPKAGNGLGQQDPVTENGPDVVVDGNRYFTRKQLARALRKSTQTLAAWAVRGYGPPFVKSGNTPLYPDDGVKRFLA